MQKVNRFDYIIYTPQGPFVYDTNTQTEILTTKYRGIDLHHETLAHPLYDIQTLQNAGYNFTEIRCLSSITQGEFDKPGDPSGEPGQYIWTQAVVYLNGKKDSKRPWIYVGDNVSPDAAARDCALHVLSNLCLRRRRDLRKAVFGYDAFQREN